jgi:hypothetical protein
MKINNTTFLGSQETPAVTGDNTILSCAAPLVALAVNDYVELLAFQTSTISLTLPAGSRQYNHLSGFRVGA